MNHGTWRKNTGRRGPSIPQKPRLSPARRLATAAQAKQLHPAAAGCFQTFIWNTNKHFNDMHKTLGNWSKNTGCQCPSISQRPRSTPARGRATASSATSRLLLQQDGFKHSFGTQTNSPSPHARSQSVGERTQSIWARAAPSDGRIECGAAALPASCTARQGKQRDRGSFCFCGIL